MKDYITEELKDYLLNTRHYLHRHPELSEKEYALKYLGGTSPRGKD